MSFLSCLQTIPRCFKKNPVATSMALIGMSIGGFIGTYFTDRFLNHQEDRLSTKIDFLTTHNATCFSFDLKTCVPALLNNTCSAVCMAFDSDSKAFSQDAKTHGVIIAAFVGISSALLLLGLLRNSTCQSSPGSPATLKERYHSII